MESFDTVKTIEVKPVLYERWQKTRKFFSFQVGGETYLAWVENIWHATGKKIGYKANSIVIRRLVVSPNGTMRVSTVKKFQQPMKVVAGYLAVIQYHITEYRERGYMLELQGNDKKYIPLLEKIIKRAMPLSDYKSFSVGDSAFFMIVRKGQNFISVFNDFFMKHGINEIISDPKSEQAAKFAKEAEVSEQKVNSKFKMLKISLADIMMSGAETEYNRDIRREKLDFPIKKKEGVKEIFDYLKTTYNGKDDDSVESRLDLSNKFTTIFKQSSDGYGPEVSNTFETKLKRGTSKPIEAFTGSSYVELTSLLVRGAESNDKAKEFIAKLDNSFRVNSHNLEGYRGYLFRGMSVVIEKGYFTYEKAINNVKVILGSEVQMLPSYTSFSTSSKIANSFGGADSNSLFTMMTGEKLVYGTEEYENAKNKILGSEYARCRFTFLVDSGFENLNVIVPGSKSQFTHECEVIFARQTVMRTKHMFVANKFDFTDIVVVFTIENKSSIISESSEKTVGDIVNEDKKQTPKKPLTPEEQRKQKEQNEYKWGHNPFTGDHIKQRKQ